ncbi:MAG TPA: hypothetical protein VIM73_22565 [Polyangiaceae bacterium]
MPAKPDSQFAASPTLVVRAPDGSERRVLALRLGRPPSAPEVARHVLVEGEGVDHLARRFYGNERLWWRILDHNPVVHPFDLGPGDTLAIPGSSTATRVTRSRRF